MKRTISNEIKSARASSSSSCFDPHNVNRGGPTSPSISFADNGTASAACLPSDWNNDLRRRHTEDAVDGACRTTSSTATSFFQRMSSSASSQKVARGSSSSTVTEEETPEFMIANEMKQLSINERESVMEDLHGVAAGQAETNAFLKTKFDRLDKELKATGQPLRHAYDRVIFLNPKYIKSRKFRLLFLRADSYDATAAAKRMMLHFEKKYQLFGYNRIAREIVWDDLEQPSKESLPRGGAQSFPQFTDSTGRVIFFVRYATKIHNCNGEYHARTMWYRFMSCLERSEETQKKGLVSIMYAHSATVKDFLNAYTTQQNNFWVTTHLPFRVAAVHFCLEDERLRNLFSLVTSLTQPAMRPRMRIHYGSNTECLYTLNTFGIANDEMPVDADGGLNFELLYKRLAMQRESEQKREELKARLLQGRIEHPLETDVLCGRGRPFHLHPGNIVFMKLVEAKKADHDKADRTFKQVVAQQVLQDVKDTGGRFLKQIFIKSDIDNYAVMEETSSPSSASYYVWEEIDDSKAHEKVAMGFRNLSRKVNK